MTVFVIGQIAVTKNGNGVTQICGDGLKDTTDPILDARQHFPDIPSCLTDIVTMDEGVKLLRRIARKNNIPVPERYRDLPPSS